MARKQVDKFGNVIELASEEQATGESIDTTTLGNSITNGQVGDSTAGGTPLESGLDYPKVPAATPQPDPKVTPTPADLPTTGETGTETGVVTPAVVPGQQAATGAFGRPTILKPSQYPAWDAAAKRIQDAYSWFLNRGASQQEIFDQLGSGTAFQEHNIRYAIGQIQNSPEAANYRKIQSDKGYVWDNRTNTWVLRDGTTTTTTTTDGGTFPAGHWGEVTDTKFDPWRPTVDANGNTVYQPPNEDTILGFLRTILPGEHTIPGLERAEPLLQYFFGPNVSVYRSEDGTVYDSLVVGGKVIDVISGSRGASGGTAWQWIPDEQSPGPPAAPPATTTPGTDTPPYSVFQPQSPWGTGGWNPFGLPQSTVAPPPFWYRPGTLPTQPISTYTPFQFNQNMLPNFGTDPNVQGINQQGRDLVSYMLANPSLSDQVLSQMKEQHKDTVLSLGEQLGQQVRQRGATRGLGSLGGGVAGQMQDVWGQQLGDITKGYRDLDVAQAGSQRQDQLSALSAMQSVLGGELNRAIQEGDWRRAGQLMQANENYRGFETQRDSELNDIQRFLAQEQLNQQGTSLGLQNYQSWLNNINQNRAMNIEQWLGGGRLNLNYGQLALEREAQQQSQRNWYLTYLQNSLRG